MGRRILVIFLNAAIMLALPMFCMSQNIESKCFQYKRPAPLTMFFRSAKKNFQKAVGLYKDSCILINQQPSVDTLKLSRGTLDLSSGLLALVEITAEASDPENDVLTYNYDISGGTIIGKGSNVVWNLTDNEPGRYSLRAWVDDGMGDCGRSLTQTILVKDSQN